MTAERAARFRGLPALSRCGRKAFARRRLTEELSLRDSRRTLREGARRRWLTRWQKKYRKLTDRVEENIGAHLLPPGAAASPESEEHQNDRAAQRGVAPANACGAHLPEHHQLPAIHGRASRRNPRGPARGQGYVNMDLRRECPAVATTSSRQPSTDPSRVLRRESRFRLLRSFAGDATQPNA